MRDLDIRQALHRELAIEHAHDPDTLIIDELGLCQGISRVDIAVINGAISGYEIKSPKDTLERLPSQSEIYNLTLDRVIIISGTEHLESVKSMVPEWWGIVEPIEEADDIYFDIIRQASDNPRLDPHSLVQLLWREEALDVLRQYGLEKGMLSKPRAAIWSKIADNIPVEDIGAIVRQSLKARSNWRSDQLQK